MLRKRRERFKELCEHADEVVEDFAKLSKIAEEIDLILDDELNRLKKNGDHHHRRDQQSGGDHERD